MAIFQCEYSPFDPCNFFEVGFLSGCGIFSWVPAYRSSRTHCSLFQEKHISWRLLAAGSRTPAAALRPWACSFSAWQKGCEAKGARTAPFHHQGPSVPLLCHPGQLLRSHSQKMAKLEFTCRIILCWGRQPCGQFYAGLFFFFNLPTVLRSDMVTSLNVSSNLVPVHWLLCKVPASIVTWQSVDLHLQFPSQSQSCSWYQVSLLVTKRGEEVAWLYASRASRQGKPGNQPYRWYSH